MLTPTPFMKKDAIFKTRPSGPGIKVVTKPQITSDIGTQKAAPNVAARRRSSGTHSPLRLLRHFTTMLSDRAPAIGEPTTKRGHKERRIDKGSRTDVSKT